MNKNIILGTLTLALGWMIYLTASMGIALKKAIKDKEFYERTIDLQFTQRIEFNEQKLKRSIDQRDSIAVRFDSLSSAHETLLRLDNKKTKELAEIKGMFDSLSSNELAEEMIKQFKRSKNE